MKYTYILLVLLIMVVGAIHPSHAAIPPNNVEHGNESIHVSPVNIPGQERISPLQRFIEQENVGIDPSTGHTQEATCVSRLRSLHIEVRAY